MTSKILKITYAEIDFRLKSNILQLQFFIVS